MDRKCDNLNWQTPSVTERHMHVPQGLNLVLLLIHPALYLLFELGEFQLDAQHSSLLALQLSLGILQDT